MKIKEIGITNISKYENIRVSLDPNLNYLVGQNGAGKTTLGLTAIHALFQGIAEKASAGKNPVIGERFRFIGPKAASGSIEIVLFDEKLNSEIRVKRKITKTGSELSFEGPEGLVLDQEWLTDLFNIFLIAPKKFTELSPIDQARAIGIDTSPYDERVAALKQDKTYITRQITSFGVLAPVAPVEKVDMSSLLAERDEIHRFNEEQAKKSLTIKEGKTKLAGIVEEKSGYEAKIKALEQQILDTKKLMLQCDERIGKGTKVVNDLPQPEPLKSFAEVDEKIKGVTTLQNQFRDYEIYSEKKKSLDKLLEDRRLNDEKVNKEIESRSDYIKSFKLPFGNLSISDDGELLLSDKPIKEPHFSTGEIIKLVPQLIASQNPELKYVFLQDFNLLDEDKQAGIIKHFSDLGFQLVIEYVSKEKISGKNCILLSQNKVVNEDSIESLPELK